MRKRGAVMQNIISVLNRYVSHINMPSVNIIDVIEILLISVFVYQFMVWIKYTRAYKMCIRDSGYADREENRSQHTDRAECNERSCCRNRKIC